MTDQDVLNEIQIHLLEDPNLGLSMSSDLWDTSQVIGHLNNSYRDFIASTRTNLEITTIPTVVGQSRYDLSDFSPDMLDISRLAFSKSPTVGHLYFNLTGEETVTPLPPRPDSSYFYNRRRGWFGAETGLYNEEYTFLGL